MNIDAMTNFLSKDNLALHLSYLNTFKLKLSILQKSDPKIADMDSYCGSKVLRRDALKLKSEIDAHEVYFNSFSDKAFKCDFLKKYYSSKEAFCYDVFVQAKECESDFLFIGKGKYGKPEIFLRGDGSRFTPCLAIDLSEHSYFLDYAFDREEYIRRAVSYLDLSRLENE